MRLYRYVGPKSIAERIGPIPTGTVIRSAGDVRAWVRTSGQTLIADCVIATFIIDESGLLLIVDRRSEHVACAGGQPVRSAGEMTFHIGDHIEVIAVSNQSTGYCPEPTSWSAVDETLSKSGFDAPEEFALACVFRRCIGCAGLNLVKEDIFECGRCGMELPERYNVQNPWRDSP